MLGLVASAIESTACSDEGRPCLESSAVLTADRGAGDSTDSHTGACCPCIHIYALHHFNARVHATASTFVPALRADAVEIIVSASTAPPIRPPIV